MKRLLVVVAACGSTPPAPDATGSQSCTATFTGHFLESSAAEANCPTLGADARLGFTVTSTAIATSFAIAIDLGASPAPGAYSSETTGSWSSLAIQTLGTGECLFVAGATETPAGSFTLALDGVAPPHGTLHVLSNVLAVAGTNCGPGDTERLEVDF